MQPVNTGPIIEFHRQQFELPPDTRPRWRKILSRIGLWLYWHTLGRFRAWLHRDCGDY